MSKDIAALARKAGGVAALERPIFLTIHHEDVFQRLVTIYQNKENDEDRFISISLTGDKPAYVQAMLPRESEMILCEGESGFYRGDSDPLVLSPQAIEILKSHGFSTDASAGNFQCEMGPVMDEDHLHGIVHALLSILYDVYDARLHAKLRFEAPLANK